RVREPQRLPDVGVSGRAGGIRTHDLRSPRTLAPDSGGRSWPITARQRGPPNMGERPRMTASARWTRDGTPKAQLPRQCWNTDGAGNGTPGGPATMNDDTTHDAETIERIRTLVRDAYDTIGAMVGYLEVDMHPETVHAITMGLAT